MRIAMLQQIGVQVAIGALVWFTAFTAMIVGFKFVFEPFPSRTVGVPASIAATILSTMFSQFSVDRFVAWMKLLLGSAIWFGALVFAVALMDAVEGPFERLGMLLRARRYWEVVLWTLDITMLAAIGGAVAYFGGRAFGDWDNGRES